MESHDVLERGDLLAGRGLGWPLLLVFLGACQGTDSIAPVGPKAKRVILVVCDTLRADRLGCYGNPRGTTPNLDAFAAQGVRYEKAYAQSSLTMPSMASLLTGRPVDEIGVGAGNRYHIGEGVTTLAEEAQRAGMVTAAVVSNFVLRAPDAEKLGSHGITQGFDHFDDELPSKERNRTLRERVAPDTTAAVLTWVDETLAAGRDDFFLLAHYIDPHGPYTPPLEFVERYTGDHDGSGELPIGQGNAGRRKIPSYQALGDETRPAVYEDRYDAEVAYVDHWIGKLLEGLEQRGMLDDALVVFTADHGESLGEEGYWFAHGHTLHMNNTRVPLLVRFPAAAGSAGRTDSTTVQHLDVSATILDAMGARLAGDPRRTLFDSPTEQNGIAIQQLGVEGSPRRWVGVATDRWHLLDGEGASPLLFDLAKDPTATWNVASEHEQVVEDLRARYRAFTGSLALPKVPGLRHKKQVAKVEESLKALGYGGEER